MNECHTIDEGLRQLLHVFVEATVNSRVDEPLKAHPLFDLILPRSERSFGANRRS